MKSLLKVISIILLSGMVLAACGTKNNKNNDNGAANSSKNNQANQRVEHPNDFPYWGYDLQHTRNVPHKKITKDNVDKLGVVWQKDLSDWDENVPNASEDYPVVKDGVMYVTTAQNRVFALDASNGKKKWEWRPPKKVRKHLNNADMSVLQIDASRGVAVAKGKVFVLMADDRLAKLDAKTGKMDKMVNLWDTMKAMKKVKLENRYYETSAPMYYKGNIYVGSSGGDNGSRGFVMAYKASNLKPAWDKPFWTTPPRGKKWMKGKYAGGGSVWTPMSFDPETDAMYFAVGNPAPDFFGKERSGDNPYTDSVVAVDSKTGKLAWAKTETGHDVWDYDAAATPMIIKAKVNGKKKKLVVEGGKNGKWFAWDAKTGKTIYDGVPFVKIKHSKPPTKKGNAKLQWPGTEGGENYAPQTYDPKSNYVLIPGINKPSKALAAKDRKQIDKDNGMYPGTKILPSPKDVDISGTITAIDVNTGKKAYQKKTDDPMRGGFTSTASGLAFYGELGGKVKAMDIKNGDILWKMDSGGKQIKMAPSIYKIDGKQYIAVISGGTKVTVYGLDGKKPGEISKQKKSIHKKGEGANHGSSGNQQGDKKQAANANPQAIFKKNCASCHGQNLEGKVGPSLKHVGKSMSKDDILERIKNGKGRMPGGIIKGEKAKAVAKWLSKKK